MINNFFFRQAIFIDFKIFLTSYIVKNGLINSIQNDLVIDFRFDSW